MPSINLAPGTQYIVEMRKRRQRLLMLSVIVIVLVIAVWGGLWWYASGLNAKQEQLATNIRNVNMQIAQLEQEAQRIVLFENRLLALDTLLDQHVTLDPVLADLERLLPAGVVLENVNIDVERGVFRISGRTETIDQIAQALASLVDEKDHPSIFTSGTLTNVAREEEKTAEGQVIQSRYIFDAELTFKAAALRKGE